MNTRDNIIDERIKDLESKKAQIISDLENLPKYITNLIVKNQSNMYNLRTCSSLDNIYEAYKIIQTEYNLKSEFNKFIKDSIDTDEQVDTLINGYSLEDWLKDFKTIVRRMILSNKIEAINKALKSLEKYYSGDRKEENAFNDLLSDIANI